MVNHRSFCLRVIGHLFSLILQQSQHKNKQDHGYILYINQYYKQQNCHNLDTVNKTVQCSTVLYTPMVGI